MLNAINTLFEETEADVGNVLDVLQSQIMKRLRLEGRHVVFKKAKPLGPKDPPTLVVNFYNIEDAPVGARAENHRALFMLTSADTGAKDDSTAYNFTVKNTISLYAAKEAGIKPLRQKTAEIVKIATYLADYINKLVEKIPAG